MTESTTSFVSLDTMAKSLARTMRAERKSDKTIYSYVLSVRLFAEWLERHGRPLTVDASRNDIRDFLTEQATPRVIIDSKGRKHRGGSPSTALVRFKSLQQFFRHCVEEDELVVSPMAGMRAPKVEPEPVPVVSDDVLAQLLKVRAGKRFEDLRDSALLRVFLDTGCRLSEVTNLRVSDVDLDEQRIRVRGKGDRVRYVTIGVKTTITLARYLRQLEREQGLDGVGPHERVWVGRQGPMGTTGITNVLHAMCRDAGVPRLHWHQLRHTFAHAWMAAGGAETDLMTQAGWQSRSMLDRYAKSAQAERAHDAARRLALGDRI